MPVTGEIINKMGAFDFEYRDLTAEQAKSLMKLNYECLESILVHVAQFASEGKSELWLDAGLEITDEDVKTLESRGFLVGKRRPIYESLKRWVIIWA